MKLRLKLKEEGIQSAPGGPKAGDAPGSSFQSPSFNMMDETSLEDAGRGTGPNMATVTECDCDCDECTVDSHHEEPIEFSIDGEDFPHFVIEPDMVRGLYDEPEMMYIIINEDTLEEGKKKKKGDRCIRIAKRKYNRWPSAYACVPEHSSCALTKKGWKYINELKVGEEILTHNLEKDCLEFKPILNLHRYKNVNTKIVRSGNNGFMFESTENHKWVIKTPETITDRKNKFDKINGFTLLETTEILKNKNNKLLVVSAPFSGGSPIIKNKIYKYGDNWIEYLLEADQSQRQAWLFSAIIYDGNQQKIERLTEKHDNIDELSWIYDGKNDKQTFGFKQKDVMHRDAFLLSAFLNQGLVTWKKSKNREIYNCHYSSNKRYKNTANFKVIKENNCDVWCPETENSTWVMKQETDGYGIITITGNSGAVVKCRQGKIWKGLKESVNPVEFEIYELTLEEAIDLFEKKKYKPNFSLEKSQGLHGWFKRNKGKGWIDCRTGKPCGRKKAGRGAKRKYPACRPTKAQCNKAGTRRKKGKATISWKPKKDK